MLDAAWWLLVDRHGLDAAEEFIAPEPPPQAPMDPAEADAMRRAAVLAAGGEIATE